MRTLAPRCTGSSHISELLARRITHRMRTHQRSPLGRAQRREAVSRLINALLRSTDGGVSFQYAIQYFDDQNHYPHNGHILFPMRRSDIILIAGFDKVSFKPYLAYGSRDGGTWTDVSGLLANMPNGAVTRSGRGLHWAAAGGRCQRHRGQGRDSRVDLGLRAQDRSLIDGLPLRCKRRIRLRIHDRTATNISGLRCVRRRGPRMTVRSRAWPQASFTTLN